MVHIVSVSFKLITTSSFLISASATPIRMMEVQDLVDMPAERVVMEPHAAAVPDGLELEPMALEEEEEEVAMIETLDDVDVDEIEPLPPLNLNEAKIYVERLFEFVCINKDQVQEAGCTNKRNFFSDVDALREAIGSMRLTANTRQTSITSIIISRN